MTDMTTIFGNTINLLLRSRLNEKRTSRIVNWAQNEHEGSTGWSNS